MIRISILLVLSVISQLSLAQPIRSQSLTRFQAASDVSPKINKNVASAKDDVWSDVTVDLKWLVGGINYQSCSQSQKAYYGCVLAVETFAAVLKKNIEVFPVAQLTIKKPLFQAATLALVEVPAPVISNAKDAYGFFAAERAKLTTRFLLASAEYFKAPNQDFELMLSAINQLAGQSVKPMAYVAAASKYIETARDPHTSIIPLKQRESEYQDSGDSFVGIGIEFMPVAQGLLVKRVVKGGGALQAGLKVGDLIVAADGLLIKDIKDEDVTTHLKGAAGTTVNLTIQRDQKSFDVVVTRSQIVNPVISSESINYNGKTYAYIRLTNFMYEKICEEFAVVVQGWEKQNVDGYLLDLRNNPGGAVTIAACIGGMFLGNKKIVAYFEKRAQLGSTYEKLETDSTVTTTKPMSVLINAGSASASEIIAGALKDYNRAYIIGQTSFGKGSYQGCGQMQGQPSLLICSTGGLFFAPSGNSNQTLGIVPHVSVFLRKEAGDSETYSLREPQLYLFPLDPKKMPNAPVSNWNQLQAPTQCMQKLDLPTVYAQAPASVSYYQDYQLLNGLGAVSCTGQN